jgi:hypothetical protein
VFRRKSLGSSGSVIICADPDPDVNVRYPTYRYLLGTYLQNGTIVKIKTKICVCTGPYGTLQDVRVKSKGQIYMIVLWKHQGRAEYGT